MSKFDRFLNTLKIYHRLPRDTTGICLWTQMNINCFTNKDIFRYTKSTKKRQKYSKPKKKSQKEKENEKEY